ncbi:Oidioi.mRNA.OKI2018_I69.chr1.g2052.t2.cds [Oikopleura dioica]|uniref:Protein Wnt n=1 Tax=Oikopleura dioica TaxID=34765 RepID=A0ABN7STR4_OIKDI|nr:Oidioi.mRNA.OKI2018_I69.chr1.g2052.t2.cds [Oikopleura dioica]
MAHIRHKLLLLLAAIVHSSEWTSLPERNWLKRNCKSRHLTKKQEQLCQSKLDHMNYVNLASKNALQECQSQFHSAAWNCTDFQKSRKDTIYGRHAKAGTKETAFITAITSASLVRELAMACRRNLAACKCGSSGMFYQAAPFHLPPGTEWDRCGDNIGYAKTFARQFVDIADMEAYGESEKCLRAVNDRSPDADKLCHFFKKKGRIEKEKIHHRIAKLKMNLHNSDAGRNTVERTKKVTCKCHGMSGSCNQKTCWHDVADIRTIGNVLKEKYDSSQRIKLSVKKRHTVGGHIVEEVELKDPNTREKRKVLPDDDLWWIQKSPNFCKPDRKKNILGTSERECDPKSEGDNGCKKMCCGRGYYKEQFKVIEECNCEFKWCCQIECEQCEVTKKVYKCK